MHDRLLKQSFQHEYLNGFVQEITALMLTPTYVCMVTP